MQNLRFLFFLLVSWLMVIISCRHSQLSTNIDFTSTPKQKGIHLFGSIDSSNILPFRDNNYDWVTLVTYAGQRDIDSPNIRMRRHKTDSIARVRRDSSWSKRINILHNAGMKVMLKPHIWLSAPQDGKWRSDIFPKNDEDWNIWKNSYREFILMHAQIAEKNDVELFCIGAEFTRLTLEKSDYWRGLIKEIRSIYSGQLTYAANWYKEYENIDFWEELDYIGVQAYFPLVDKLDPTVEALNKGWQKYIDEMLAISSKHKKKILFTELGYKSTNDSAIKPWEWVEDKGDQETTKSFSTQENCYQAFFDSVWDQPWFAGVHIWQSRTDHMAGRGYSDLNFTPQGKPAEKIIAREFE